MPKKIAPLSDMQVSKAKSPGDQYSIRDGGGLYLVVTPSGGKLWRMDYRYEGKRLTYSAGAYSFSIFHNLFSIKTASSLPS